MDQAHALLRPVQAHSLKGVGRRSFHARGAGTGLWSANGHPPVLGDTQCPQLTEYLGVALQEACHQDGEEVPYFAMQHVPGEPLSDILQESDPPALDDVWRWTIETLEALDAIHRAGYLHRDVKPGNVLVDRSAPAASASTAPRPAVRLIDFGIAVPLEAEPESFFIGTPEFSAPERIECEPPDVRSDLYSVGLLLYDGLTNRDFPMVQGVVLMMGVMIVLLNLMLDVLYAYVDPRIRLSR